MVINNYYERKLINKNTIMTNLYHESIFKSFLILLTQNRYVLVRNSLLITSKYKKTIYLVLTKHFQS